MTRQLIGPETYIGRLTRVEWREARDGSPFFVLTLDDEVTVLVFGRFLELCGGQLHQIYSLVLSEFTLEQFLQAMGGRMGWDELAAALRELIGTTFIVDAKLRQTKIGLPLTTYEWGRG